MKFELRKYSFGETIGEGFNLYFNNFLFLLAVSLVATIPSTILQYFKQQAVLSASKDLVLTLTIFDMLVGVLVGILVSGLIIRVISKRFLGKELTSDDYFKNIIPLFLPLLGLTFLELAIIGAVLIPLLIPGAIMYAGFVILILIIPVMIILLGFSVSAHALVIEEKGIINAIKSSWELTRGKRWYIFGLLIVIGFIQGMIIGIPTIMVMQINASYMSNIVIIHIISAIASPLQACVLLVLFYSLKVEKQGFNIEHLAEQFSMSDRTRELDDF